jgi:hypothetical protein
VTVKPQSLRQSNRFGYWSNKQRSISQPPVFTATACSVTVHARISAVAVQIRLWRRVSWRGVGIAVAEAGIGSVMHLARMALGCGCELDGRHRNQSRCQNGENRSFHF